MANYEDSEFHLPTFEHAMNWYKYTNKLAQEAGVNTLHMTEMDLALFAEVPYSDKLSVLGEL